MHSLLQDFRYGLRMMAKTPGFTAVAVITLALGIGATTSIFTVVKAALLAPLPFTEPERLLAVGRTTPDGDAFPAAPATARAWRERNTVFENIAFSTDVSFNLTGAGEPQTLFGYLYDSRMLDVLGVKPMLGRPILPEEEFPGSEQVVLLSHKLWQSKFGGRESVVGESITLNGEPHTVIGVMPPGFAWPEHAELWAAMQLADATWQSHTSNFIRTVGRLKPGVTRQQAQEQLSAITASLARENPQAYSSTGVHLRTMREGRVADIEKPLLALWGAVGFVLLIACSNISGLLLARVAARRKEIAVRLALGASARRLVRQLLTESLLLAVVSGAGGLLLAVWARNALLALIPRDVANLQMPNIEHLPIDPGVVLFVLGISMASTVLFGLAPALQALRTSPGESLGERSTVAGGRRQSRLRQVMVVGEVALALVLLTGAGLMIRTMQSLQESDLGFDPSQVLTLEVSLPNKKYPDATSRAQFVDAVLPRMQALPGVREVGVVSFLPLTGFNAAVGIVAEGRDYAPGENPVVGYHVATEGYFRALRIPLLRGRLFNEHDRPGAQPVVLVNQSLAHRVFGGEDPVGKRLGSEQLEWLIVGVVGDAHYEGIGVPPQPAVYFPYGQETFFWVSFTLRTESNDPFNVAAAARSVISQVDKDLPVFRTMSLERLAHDSVALNRGTTVLLGAMAALALLLAAVGIYGLLAFTVVQRTHEIGVRMALGAGAAQVLRMVLVSGARLVGFGLILGLVGALVVTRVLGSLLHGVSSTDPLTFAAVASLLAAVALLACYIPARRATQVDPMVALRAE